jgi:nucleoside-diphosphate-sugar epimerase
MKIVVIGGRGVLGSKVVGTLAKQGHSKTVVVDPRRHLLRGASRDE